MATAVAGSILIRRLGSSVVRWVICHLGSGYLVWERERELYEEVYVRGAWGAWCVGRSAAAVLA
jgi:hypothetical protein